MAVPDITEVEAYIRSVATTMGIDPNIAVRVAKSEGLAPGVWQSNLKRPDGSREKSYGPFQLFEGGGLGNKFKSVYGVSASDPSTWKQQVQFALGEAKKGGWTPWYGAKNSGIGRYEGIRQGASSPTTQASGPNRGLTQPSEMPFSPSQGPGDAVVQDPATSFMSKLKSNAEGFGDAMSQMNGQSGKQEISPIGPATGYAPMQVQMTKYLSQSEDPMSLLRKLGLM